MSENTNVNATVENATVAAPVDQGELQGVPSAAEVKEIDRAKRRERLSRKADSKGKGKGEPAPSVEGNGKASKASKGKGKDTPEAPAPEIVAPESNGKASKGKGLALKIKAGRIVNIKDVFAATNNGKPYAVSRFIIRLLTAVLGRKWDRKVGDGMGNGLEYHWVLKTAEEGTAALQHATDAARSLGYKLGTGNGDGDGCVLVEPDGKANAKVNRLVFAY